MLIDHQTPLDLNVRVTVFDENGNVVRRSKFKNTATQRMTTGIALFLAGDEATYENRTAPDVPASGKGRWRPNFISFATTGIDEQPSTANGKATVLDPEAFENRHPDPGQRTRPWFYSKYLGEHADGFWKPEYGWGTPEHPDKACFQGELVTAMLPTEEENWEDKTIRRHPILRADVTTDSSAEREVGQEGYSTDCILYGYASVLWLKQFFEPEHGPSVPRIAISEVGLYEMDSDTEVGRRTLMAGFRVPRVEDIIYVDPGYVVLVEWRITIRALMPYEEVGLRDDIIYPTGLSINVNVIDEKTAQLTAIVHGPALVSQEVNWVLEGNRNNRTTLSNTGLLKIADNESADVLYATATSVIAPEIHSMAAVITGLITDVVTGMSITTVSSDNFRIQLKATVLGKGNFVQDVTWEMTGAEHPDTTISSTGLITIAFEETAHNLNIKATSVADPEICSVAAVVRIDKVSGTYLISDFTILT